MLLACAYPFYMGVKILIEIARSGYVRGDSYPKYVIPYTPLSIALIIAILLLPLLLKYLKKFAAPFAFLTSTGIFFLFEFLLENKVTVVSSGYELVPVGAAEKLEAWQMYLCIAQPQYYETRSYDLEMILSQTYSPLMKAHFYIISVLIILAVLGCIYGFARMIATGNTEKKVPLIMQTVSTILFISMCVFACFTAFFRTGSMLVSPLSALLMILFFVVFGLTLGLFVGSFLFGKKPVIAILIPALAALAGTTLMYIAETFLIGGQVYRFGTGWFFAGVPGLRLAPVDFLVILLSGGVTACAMLLSRRLAGRRENK